jgi:hypothetical protein
MRTATALTLMAIGAIFTFAITAHPSFLNLQVVGLVLIVTGVCGLVLPRRGRGWLRRSVLLKGSPDFTNVHRDEREDTAELAPVPDGWDGQPQPDLPVERESVVEFTEK